MAEKSEIRYLRGIVVLLIVIILVQVGSYLNIETPVAEESSILVSDSIYIKNVDPEGDYPRYAFCIDLTNVGEKTAKNIYVTIDITQKYVEDNRLLGTLHFEEILPDQEITIYSTKLASNKYFSISSTYDIIYYVTFEVFWDEGNFVLKDIIETG